MKMSPELLGTLEKTGLPDCVGELLGALRGLQASLPLQNAGMITYDGPVWNNPGFEILEGIPYTLEAVLTRHAAAMSRDDLMACARLEDITCLLSIYPYWPGSDGQPTAGGEPQTRLISFEKVRQLSRRVLDTNR